MRSIHINLKSICKNKILIGSLIYLSLIIVSILIFNIKSLTISDGLLQYSAFIQNSMARLFSGEWYKITYDSTLGLGQPFINVFFYYGMSPFNLLLGIPFITMSTVIFFKIIILALSINYFFSKKFKQLSIKEHLVVTLMFLASNSVMIVILNYIWLDSTIGMIWLLYLIDSKVKHKNLYITLVVMYMIWSNFYLSVIFLLFLGFYALISKQIRSAIFMILGGLMSITPIILGSYQNLITRKLIYSPKTPILSSPKDLLLEGLQLLTSPIQVFGGASKYMGSSINLGLSSLFLIIAIVIIIKNYRNPKVWIIGAMMLSVISPKINAIYHGGQLPNGWNYRFSPLITLLLLSLVANEICDNRSKNKSSFLQLETLINKKYLSLTATVYISLLIITTDFTAILYPEILQKILVTTNRDLSVILVCVGVLILIITIIVSIILINKNKFDLIEICTFSTLILLIITQFGMTYKLVKKPVSFENMNSLRNEYKSWESQQSNKTLLNSTIKITNDPPTLINPKISQSSAFVTPVSPYLESDQNIYTIDSNRVKYNANEGLNPISNLLYGSNFELNSKKHKWRSINNLDRGFIINKYTTPTSINSYINMLSTDTVSLKSNEILNIKKIKNNKTSIWLDNSVKSDKTYVLQYPTPNLKNNYMFKVLKKGKNYTLDVNTIDKDHIKIYESPRFMHPKSQYKNTFEITSGQTKDYILKGNAKSNGDLILKVLYDKNLHAKINGKDAKLEKAFGALTVIPHVKSGDTVELYYYNPIIKPMKLISISSLFGLLVILVIWKLKNKRT